MHAATGAIPMYMASILFASDALEAVAIYFLLPFSCSKKDGRYYMSEVLSE